MRLHLGVIDVPYQTGPTLRPSRAARRPGSNVPPNVGQTTGDVAEILEDHYHVMEFFYEDLGPDVIVKALEQSMENALADIQAGGPPTLNLTQDGEEEIRTAFQIFIDQEEMDNIAPGVPTAASIRGVNHRLAHPYAKGNPSRPSFKDTGLYQQSFRAWTTE